VLWGVFLILALWIVSHTYIMSNMELFELLMYHLVVVSVYQGHICKIFLILIGIPIILVGIFHFCSVYLLLVILALGGFLLYLWF
jgi:hypothetical protein